MQHNNLSHKLSLFDIDQIITLAPSRKQAWKGYYPADRFNIHTSAWITLEVLAKLAEVFR